VVLAVAFETTELVTVSVVLVSKATVNVTASLTGVLWRDFLDSDAVLGGFVLGVLLDASERPLLEFAGVRDAFSDMCQLLECDMRRVVNECFLYQRLRDTMQVVFAPVGEPSAE